MSCLMRSCSAGGDGGRKLLEGQGERRVFGLLGRQLFHLLQSFDEQIFRWNAVVVHADGHVGGDLVEGVGESAKPRDPVVIVLDVVKAELRDQLRVVGIDAAHLVDGHLPLFKLGGLLVVGDGAHQDLAAVLFLLRQPGGIDGGETEQDSLFAGQALVEGFDGEVADLIVVALVADGGGEFRGVLQALLPVLLEDGVEGFAAVFERSGGCLRVAGWDDGEGEGREYYGKEGRLGKGGSFRQKWSPVECRARRACGVPCSRATSTADETRLHRQRGL